MIQPVDYAPSQNFGENPTAALPGSHWLIKAFGNYQPDGHTGRDYPCPAGTPVRAVTDGVVLHAGYFGGTYADNPWWIMPSFAGYTYVVDHGWFIGIYGHCRDGGSKVRIGQTVKEGKELGPSGNTGASTGDHLHFEALPDGYVLNSHMYGRIDPGIIFANSGGTINYQSTNKPTIEEDELSDAQVERIINEINAANEEKHKTTRDAVKAVAAQVVGQRFQSIGTNGKVNGETTIGNVLGAHDANVVLTRGVVTGAAEAVAKTVAAINPGTGIDPEEQGRRAAAAFLSAIDGLHLGVISPTGEAR